MRKLFDVLEKLEATPSRLDKEDILTKNQSEELKFAFETALNPFFVYGAFDFDDGKEYRSDIPTLKELRDLRSSLLNKTLTGNTAKEELRKTLLTADPIAKKWLVRMFKKDLICGASTKSVNKIFKGFIPEFNIGLCDSWDEDAGIFKTSKWIAEPKYDGNRAVAFIDEEYNATIVSRNNKPLYNVDHILAELTSICKKHKLNNVIMDGELYGKDWNESTSIIRSSKSSVDNTKIFYYIFDMVHAGEWANRVTKRLMERKEEITKTLMVDIDGYKNIKITPWFSVNSVEEADKVYKAKLKEGFEGLVLKQTTSMYPFGRSLAWLKWKPFETYDVRITGWENGKKGSKYETILGAFICELDGVEVKVGGGFSDKQRVAFWNDREKMKGMVIEVECQEKTKDGSLRFPVFSRIREDKS